MSAEVLGCGHACHLMEIDFIEDIPQVHLHFLTEEEEYSELGYGKVEVVCHGCGDSILIYYNEGSGYDSKHLKVRDSFAAKHQHCPNKQFEEHCPDYRSGFKVIDLRVKPRAKRWPEARKKPVKKKAAPTRPLDSQVE